MVLTNQHSEQEVHDLFSRVASKYDLMNNVISLGIQKRWRRTFIKALNLQKNDLCLDLCCGTGDNVIAMAKYTKQVTGLDFNEQMLHLAREKILRAQLIGKIRLVKGDAMDLPFAPNSFDQVTICFGLRNVPDAGKTIAEAYRVLKPGGQFAILEMSQPTAPIIKLGWQIYFGFFPFLAKLTHNQVKDYQYLAQTSKSFLSATALKKLLEQKGFKDVKIIRLTWGAGAIHLAYKV